MVTAAAARQAAARQAAAWRTAAEVADPEMPYLTVADLGILRSVIAEGDRTVVVVTPTYSGCPAITEIKRDLAARLTGAGFGPVEVRTALAPPWSTDWISDVGRAKLTAAGIAPPEPSPQRDDGPVAVTLQPKPVSVRCPNCGALAAEELSRFSATACKSLFRCRACLEPFEHLKAI